MEWNYNECSSKLHIVAFFPVFDILLRYTETGSWKEAFFQVIPKRKQMQQSSSAGVQRLHDEDSAEDKQVETMNLLQTLDSACDTDDIEHVSSSEVTSGFASSTNCSCEDS